MGRTPFLIDTDPGTDDAIALLMLLGAAHRLEIDIRGITTVGGNASLARTTRNTLAPWNTPATVMFRWQRGRPGR